MRNILADLQERLDAVAKERIELQQRIADLEPVEAAIKALMKREDETFVSAPSAPVVATFSAPVVAAPPAPVGDNRDGFAARDSRIAVKPGHWGELLRAGASH